MGDPVRFGDEGEPEALVGTPEAPTTDLGVQVLNAQTQRRSAALKLAIEARSKEAEPFTSDVVEIARRYDRFLEDGA